MARDDVSTAESRPNKTVATIFGAIYLLVGLVGFAVTGMDQFADTDTNEKLLGIFEINPLHNLVHLAIGLALLLAAKAGEAAARSVNMAVGATYLLVGLLGLFIASDDNSANILSLNGADNLLHLASAAVLLGVSLMRSRTLGGDRSARV